jgi:hypothetical protein
MYEISRWKLESGSTIQSLEQFLGSRSVGSVVTTQLHFRALNSLGLSLLLIWAFSPLGSQSILRILGSHLESTESISTVTYYDNLHESGFASITVEDNKYTKEVADLFFQYLNTLFSAALVTSETTKLDTMDHWGNVKIPFFSHAETGSESAGTEWQELSQVSDLERYSSLVGIPVVNLSPGNTTLSIESTYIELECSNITSPKPSQVIDISWTWDTVQAGEEDITSVPENGTWEGITIKNANGDTAKGYAAWSMALNRFVDCYWINETAQDERRGVTYDESDPDDPSEIFYAFDNSPERFINETGIYAGPTELLFQSSFTDHLFGDPVNFEARCHVRQRYIESRISCEQHDSSATRQNCTVTAQRPSQSPHVTELISHLNFPRVWAWISQELPQAVAFGNSSQPDMVAQYLNDPRLNNITLVDTDDIFKKINNTIFSRRLSQILNTYLYLSQVFVAAPGGDFGDENVTLSATTTVLIEVYAISPSWTAAGVISCAVLLIGGVLSVIYRHMVTGPEVLGYASSTIRDSKYINLPFDSSKMNGLDISKMMKNQRVRYGFTDLTKDGRLSVGVGLEEETTRIKDKARLL